MPYSRPARASFIADQKTIDRMLRLSWSALRPYQRTRFAPMPAGLPAERIGQGPLTPDHRMAAQARQGRVV